jgi:hypothetical protein
VPILKASARLRPTPHAPAPSARARALSAGLGRVTSWAAVFQGLSGYAAPGQLLVIMGASGAGKTTLVRARRPPALARAARRRDERPRARAQLNALADRRLANVDSTLEAEILVNGRPKDSAFKEHCAYV